jgi:hypothetical protein
LVYDKVVVFELSFPEQKGLLRAQAVAIDATTLKAKCGDEKRRS